MTGNTQQRQSAVAATSTDEHAGLADAVPARRARLDRTRQQRLPALRQRRHLRLRQQLDAMGPLAVSITSLHQHIGMRTDSLARRSHERCSLGRQFDHVRRVDRVQAARFQLDQDQPARSITVRPIYLCGDLDEAFRLKEPLGIGQLRGPQVLRKPSIRVAMTLRSQ